MKKSIKNIFFKWISSVKPTLRRVLLVFADTAIIPIVIWFGFFIKHENPLSEEFLSSVWIIFASVFISLPLYFFTGQYKGLTRYVGSKSLYYLILRNAVLVVILMIYGKIFNLSLPSGSNLILFWILVSSISGGLRFLLRDLLLYFSDKKGKRITKIGIYGAGASGAQLETTLRLAGNYQVEFFIDDDQSLWGRSLNNIPIKSYEYLLKNNSNLDEVLIAIPSLNKSSLKKIINPLKKLNITVMRIPSFKEITNNKSDLDSLKPILIEDIVGRDTIPPDLTLLSSAVDNKVVLITGAGGSIGSELSKTVLSQNPKLLVLLERNEPSLYKIKRELESKHQDKKIVTILGCASNLKLIEHILSNFSINLVLHTAAYKHVPLVEENPIVGLENNIFSTMVICEASQKFSIDKVVLISSDKAVRPTNIMGVSKRISELIVQGFSDITSDKNNQTIFSIVRFGNVLGSSGSVVPLFREQITKGGPITITDKNMVRYFMTIEEASYLVIQASALAKSGEILLLDMGDPIYIRELAEKMIDLAGLTLKNKTNPDGDIEIMYTGKRPGEKLYEELLISAKSEKTNHPLIFKAREEYLPSGLLFKKLKDLKIALINLNSKKTFSILKDLVPEWQKSKP